MILILPVVSVFLQRSDMEARRNFWRRYFSRQVKSRHRFFFFRGEHALLPQYLLEGGIGVLCVNQKFRLLFLYHISFGIVIHSRIQVFVSRQDHWVQNIQRMIEQHRSQDFSAVLPKADPLQILALQIRPVCHHPVKPGIGVLCVSGFHQKIMELTIVACFRPVSGIGSEGHM